MDYGIIAMIDALGWRGIWRRYEPADLVANHQTLMSRLERTRDTFLAAISDYVDRTGNAHLQPVISTELGLELRFLSDTLVVALRLARNGPPPDMQATTTQSGIAMMGSLLETAVQWAATCDTPYTYRGHVTMGRYAVEQNLLLGEAVDECAHNHELADGAIIWLDPRIEVDPAVLLPEARSPQHWMPYEVPLKTETVSTHALAVRASNRTSNAILNTFTTDVQQKRANTERYLKECSQFNTLPNRT